MPAFEVPTSSESFRDCFIDDIIDCHLDTENNKRRSGHIVQLAVHVMSRPHAGDEIEPVPRKPLLGPDKLEAEGRSAERQIVLGWEIRTRDLKVALPYDKHLAWREDLAGMIQAGKARGEPKGTGVHDWPTESRLVCYTIESAFSKRDSEEM
jgi:hypothetical protein